MPTAPRPLSTEGPIYMQQDKESGEAFEAFEAYRDEGRGERNLISVAAGLDKSVQLMGRWSARWSWRPRVMAWDKRQDALNIELHWEEIAKMSRRHASQAVAMGQILMGPAMAIFRIMQARPDVFYEYFMVTGSDGELAIDFDRMDRVVSMAMQAARLMPTVIGMERIARGEPTEIVEERADSRYAATQFLGDPATRTKAQELFALINGQSMPQLPAAITGNGDEGA